MLILLYIIHNVYDTCIYTCTHIYIYVCVFIYTHPPPNTHTPPKEPMPSTPKIILPSFFYMRKNEI